MHFRHPEWAFLGIAAFLVLLGYFFLYFFRRSVLTDYKIDPSQLIEREFEITKAMLLTLSMIFAIVALMRPVGGAHYIKGTEVKMEDVIFALDASASMEIGDTQTGVSRFNLGREIIGDTSQNLGSGQVSLVSFTSDVTPLVPATFDHFFMQLFLTQVQINEGGVPGTDLGAILDWMKDQKGTGILLTDGGDTLYPTQPEEREKVLVDKAEALENPLIVVGIGGETPKKIPGFDATSKLEESLLEKIAESSGGTYFRPSERVTGEIVASIADRLQTPKQMGKEERIVNDEWFYYPLAAALACLVLFFVLPDTRRES